MPDPTSQLWPFTPNWRAGVETSPGYRTDIITSRSGKEQRRALRTQPRRTISYTVTVAREDRNRLVRLLAKWQARPITMADPTRRVVTPVYEPPAWLIDGAAVVIDNAAVTFDPATTYPDGTVIQPALTGLLSGTVEAQHDTSTVAEAKITFAVDPGSETIDRGEPGLYVLNGREVLAKRPNWASGISEQFEWPTEQVDFGHGRIETFRPIDTGWFTQQADYVGLGAEGAAEIESFFHRMYGRRGEFYMPTGTADLTIGATAVADSTTLTVAGRETFDDFADDPRYRAIALQMRDGRLLLRQIASMSLAGANTVLTVTEPWTTAFTPADVAKVSWMPVFRFANDELTVQWPTDGVAQLQLSMRSLKDLPPERPVTGLDGAAQWLLETWGEDGVVPFDELDYAVNIRYPATFFWPLAWVNVRDDVADSLDRLVNIHYPEAVQ